MVKLYKVILLISVVFFSFIIIAGCAKDGGPDNTAQPTEKPYTYKYTGNEMIAGDEYQLTLKLYDNSQSATENTFLFEYKKISENTSKNYKGEYSISGSIISIFYTKGEEQMLTGTFSESQITVKMHVGDIFPEDNLILTKV